MLEVLKTLNLLDIPAHPQDIICDWNWSLQSSDGLNLAGHNGMVSVERHGYGTFGSKLVAQE
jgi:hypothetical protein